MLRRSIGKTFGAAEPQSLHTHVGLWIDKMLLAEEPSSEVSGPHLRKIAEPPIPDGYALAYRARRALFEVAAERRDVLLFEAKATSRMVVGLGAKGVLEMGLTLDHTWGTPFIPGSALKGLCAAAAHKLAEGKGWRKPEGWPQAAPADLAELTDYQMLFGTTANAAQVTFHDAWWVPIGTSMPIHMDVMTVHHPKYYQSDATGPVTEPTDFDEPVPVPFLSTSGTFLIALAGPRLWCEAAGKLLRGGLGELGVGAKTSSGYGRMALTPIVTEAERAQKQSLDELNSHFRGYRPGTKDVGVRALVRAIQLGAGTADVLAALRQVDKGHRPGLLEGARAQLDERGRRALDEVVADLTTAAVTPAPVKTATPAAPAEARRRRARFAVDPTNAKRFFIHVEGEKKAIKGAVVDINAELLEKMRTTGEWVDVLLWSGPGKTKIEPG